MTDTGGVAAQKLTRHLVALSQSTAPAERSKVLGAYLKETLARVTKDAFREYPAHGEKIASILSDCIDDFGCGLLVAGEDAFPDMRGKIAIIATGGYGRGRLAPFSDIDLLFLYQGPSADATKPLLSFVLYGLWDAGLTVSQSVRTPIEAIKFAKTDVHAQTAFLDARFLAGNADLYADFFARYEKMRKKSAARFVAAKLNEREERHQTQQASRYALEPDLKEGKGALRDLDTLHWLDSYVFGAGEIEQRVRTGYLTYEEAKIYGRIMRFLWSVRVHLHQLRGRADDILSFDVQPEIAKRLGYRDRGDTPAAERLMKHYFLHAREIGQLSGVVLAVLEQEGYKKPAEGNGKIKIVIPIDKAPGKANLTVKRGRLDFADHQIAEANTLDIFRLFRAAGRLSDVYIHPDAKKTITRHAGHYEEEIRLDPQISSLFANILTSSQNTEAVLREMTDTGILGQYLLSYGRVVGKVEYGLFRQYTVDEHVLKSVHILDQLRDRIDPDRHPRAQAIIARATNLLPFYLAVLVHETAIGMGKATIDQVQNRAQLSVRRFLDDPAEAKKIGYVAAHKSLMAKTAARRNVLDLKVISRFASKLGSQEYLDLLLVVTVCHLRVAGCNSWDDWVRDEVGLLYDVTTAWFDGGEEAIDRFIIERTKTQKQATQKALKNTPATQHMDRLGPRFWTNGDVDMTCQLVHLIDQVDQAGVAGGAELRALKNGLIRVVAYSKDRPGLFSDIAGTVASLGGTVRAASAYPVADFEASTGMACNVFVFQGAQGAVLLPDSGADIVLEQFRVKFNQAVADPSSVQPQLRPRLGDRRKGFDIPSEIRIDLDASEVSTVIEAEGLDRPGLLYQLTKVLSDLGVSIQRASIATYGERAVDTFYLQDLPSHKITNKRRLEGIKRRLLSVLQQR